METLISVTLLLSLFTYFIAFILLFEVIDFTIELEIKVAKATFVLNLISMVLSIITKFYILLLPSTILLFVMLLFWWLYESFKKESEKPEL